MICLIDDVGSIVFGIGICSKEDVEVGSDVSGISPYPQHSCDFGLLRNC